MLERVTLEGLPIWACEDGCEDGCEHEREPQAPAGPPREACPACGGPTVDRGAGVWCSRCGKISSCCDGGDMGPGGRPGL